MRRIQTAWASRAKPNESVRRSRRSAHPGRVGYSTWAPEALTRSPQFATSLLTNASAASAESPGSSPLRLRFSVALGLSVIELIALFSAATTLAGVPFGTQTRPATNLRRPDSRARPGWAVWQKRITLRGRDNDDARERHSRVCCGPLRFVPLWTSQPHCKPLILLVLHRFRLSVYHFRDCCKTNTPRRIHAETLCLEIVMCCRLRAD